MIACGKHKYVGSPHTCADNNTPSVPALRIRCRLSKLRPLSFCLPVIVPIYEEKSSFGMGKRRCFAWQIFVFGP